MRSCEVCRSFRPELSSRSPFQADFGKRSVALCATHHYLWRCAKVTTFEGFRKLFHESRGKRSFVPRRTRADEARARERRGNSGAGRRASDHEVAMPPEAIAS